MRLGMIDLRPLPPSERVAGNTELVLRKNRVVGMQDCANDPLLILIDIFVSESTMLYGGVCDLWYAGLRITRRDLFATHTL